MNVKNKELYNALVALTKRILVIVATRIKVDLPVTIESRWIQTDQGIYKKDRVQSPEWSLVFLSANDEIIATKEYQAFLDALNSDGSVSHQLDTLVGNPITRGRLEAIDIARLPVREFLTDKGVLEFHSPTFDDIYSKIEDSLYSEFIEMLDVTPLCGFAMEDAELSLAEGISIVKLTQEAVLECLRIGIRLGTTIGGHDFISDLHPYAIKRILQLPKIVGEVEKSVNKNLQEYYAYENEKAVVDSLRVYKSGTLYPIATFKKTTGIFPLGISLAYLNPVKQFMTNQYRLSNLEACDFREFFKEKSGFNIPDKNFLNVAIRRFSQSNERTNIEDKIIDLMIAAEALFLSSGGSFTGELKYRLSHRAAMFIEGDVENQRYVFDFMKDAYDVRSKIVHGDKLKLPKKPDGSMYNSLGEFCNNLEKYMRISIKKAITLCQDSNSIDWQSIVFPSSDSSQ